MPGTIVGLYTAEAAGEPVMSHAEVEVVAGLGIPGDRYATGRGYWSDPRWPDQELTFAAAEVAETIGLEPALLRRNVVTRGVDLDALIGVTFRAGTALLQGVRRCDPCGHLDSLTRPGVARALRERGGLRTRVLASGRIAVGDRIEPAALTPRTSPATASETASE
ncbi:MAG TPA: MOSC domain-containing protein, partial [Dehalococcoidia bacterium]|nr:MOSC domain-containing protein [Dehalococcoidia bacterium]